MERISHISLELFDWATLRFQSVLALEDEPVALRSKPFISKLIKQFERVSREIAYQDRNSSIQSRFSPCECWSWKSPKTTNYPYYLTAHRYSWYSAKELRNSIISLLSLSLPILIRGYEEFTRNPSAYWCMPRNSRTSRNHNSENSEN